MATSSEPEKYEVLETIGEDPVTPRTIMIGKANYSQVEGPLVRSGRSDGPPTVW